MQEYPTRVRLLLESLARLLGEDPHPDIPDREVLERVLELAHTRLDYVMRRQAHLERRVEKLEQTKEAE